MALCAVLVAACGGGAQQTNVSSNGDDRIAQAKTEGTLNWYTGSDPTGAQATATAFEQKYGIKVAITRLTSADLGQRFNAEANAGKVQADVLSTVDPSLFDQLHKDGAIRSLTPDIVPSISGLGADYKIDDSSAAVFGIGTTVAVYNSSVLPNFQGGSWKSLLA